MSTVINAILPNPSSAIDPQWAMWDEFIAANSIQTCREPVVRCYQCLDDQPGGFMRDDLVNHLLNLRAEGVTSTYANEAEDQFGQDYDSEDMEALDKTLSALAEVFSAKSYRFSEFSSVYKGVCTKPYYTVHRFESIAVNAVVTFQGFLSTSVCREKSEAFAGTQGVLLVITGLDKVDCIVPENTKVISTPMSHISEHEVLLNFGTKMLVREVLPGGGMRNREVHLEVV